MKSIISIIILTIVFSMKAQDLNTSSLNFIDINNWMNTPHVKGRFATLDDYKNNRAVYGSDNYTQKYIPVDLEIPFLALKEGPILGIKDTVVVIQAHKIKGGIYTGFKYFHSAYGGTSLLKDLIIIDKNKLNTGLESGLKKTKIINSQNNLSKEKINIIIPNCGIGSQWNRLKYSLNEEYWAVYEQINSRNGGNFLIKKYDQNRPTVPNFLIKGLSLKDSLFTHGKWIDRMLYLGESIYFRVENLDDESRSKTYSIYAKGNLIEKENNEFPYFKKIENYELIVDSHKDKVQQTIIKKDINSWDAGGFEGGVYIYWIGDLNGDKRLDMLVGTNPNYKGMEIFLFLSDNTSKQLFKEYIVGGCYYD